jgi:hypothetical protein
MGQKRKRLHRLPGVLLIVGVAVVITWVAASVALSNLKPDVLAADLSSSLKADYSGAGAGTIALSPIDETVIESVAQDERERGASEIVFAPIFLGDEGNQVPVRLPSGEVQPAPTPSPTQPGGPTPEAGPTQPPQPTAEPKPTQPDHPTPEPKPTQPDQPTPRPKPTQPDHPTPEPKPTQPDQPTPRPKPTQPDQPTPKPHPTPRVHSTPSP